MELNPIAEIVNEHTQLKALFEKLGNASNSMTKSLDVGYFIADIGTLSSEISNQQNSAEEIQSITDELDNKLIKN